MHRPVLGQSPCRRRDGRLWPLMTHTRPLMWPATAPTRPPVHLDPMPIVVVEFNPILIDPFLHRCPADGTINLLPGHGAPPFDRLFYSPTRLQTITLTGDGLIHSSVPTTPALGQFWPGEPRSAGFACCRWRHAPHATGARHDPPRIPPVPWKSPFGSEIHSEPRCCAAPWGIPTDNIGRSHRW